MSADEQFVLNKIRKGDFDHEHLSFEIVAKAWRNDEFLEDLDAVLRHQIPDCPVGEVDLGAVYRSGQVHEIYAGTVAASCSTVAASCSTVSSNCSSIAATCSTVAAKCSTVASTCSTIAAKCSTVAATCSTVAASCSTVAANCGKGRRRRR